MRTMQESEEGGGTRGCKTLLECRGEQVRYGCNAPDPLASGECHAQEGTRALPGQRQRTGGATGPVEGGTGVGSIAMGVVVSRGDSIGKSEAAEGISETKSARGGMACVKADTDVLCGGEGSVVAGAGMGAVGAAGRVVAEEGSGKGVGV